ncbi:cupin domain-containing protein [Sulfurimonas sp. HSL-1716]|uniref:cupin domain-containing protein n=1 Tax=Hydrocurvibacter sulfurireducens TaxID=3131937 RepID=UPI0031F87A48
MHKISKTNAEHYIWGKECEGWHLLKSDGLSVIEERMPPHTSEAMHYHEHSQQVFYILFGVATMKFSDKTIQIQAGESLHINAKIAHQMCNESDEELCFLVVSQPKSHGDKIVIN